MFPAVFTLWTNDNPCDAKQASSGHVELWTPEKIGTRLAEFLICHLVEN